jgi:hypothetical protein
VDQGQDRAGDLAAGRDIAAYLALYRERRAGLLARGDPAGYDKRVASTWSLAFARLQEDEVSHRRGEPGNQRGRDEGQDASRTGW